MTFNHDLCLIGEIRGILKANVEQKLQSILNFLYKDDIYLYNRKCVCTKINGKIKALKSENFSQM